MFRISGPGYIDRLERRQATAIPDTRLCRRAVLTVEADVRPVGRRSTSNPRLKAFVVACWQIVEPPVTTTEVHPMARGVAFDLSSTGGDRAGRHGAEDCLLQSVNSLDFETLGLYCSVFMAIQSTTI